MIKIKMKAKTKMEEQKPCRKRDKEECRVHNWYLIITKKIMSKYEG